MLDESNTQLALRTGHKRVARLLSMLHFLDINNHLAVTHMDKPQVDICKT